LRIVKARTESRRFVAAFAETTRHMENIPNGLYHAIFYISIETVALFFTGYLFVLAKIDALKKFFLCFLMFSIRYSFRLWPHCSCYRY
jgi:hypothetical protein